MTAAELPEVPTPGPAPEYPTTFARWTHRHPVMEVRTQVLPPITRGTPNLRTFWRPHGTNDPWVPCNIHDLARMYIEIVPKGTE